jgi:hypothetical protein
MEPQEITEELEHPGARNLLDSAVFLGNLHRSACPVDGFRAPGLLPLRSAGR